MKSVWLTILLMAISFSAEVNGYACVCAGPKNAKAGLSKAKAVFSGKVIESSAAGWVFEVERVWKGKGIQQRVIVKDYEPDSTCGWSFSVGESYLLFADIIVGESQSAYVPQVCNYTSILSRAEESLKLIGEGKPVKSESKPLN